MEIKNSLSTKLRLIMIALLSIFMLRAVAQQKVNASQIMQDIKSERDISYENVTIIGDLDFTYMEEKMDELPSKNRWGNDNEIEEMIEVNVSFKDCTFTGNVLAYIHHEKSGYTFTASFDRNVVFKNCTFEEDAMFKYSEFDGVADFSGSVFTRKSTFKYAEFDRKAYFSNTTFDDESIFKYTEFDKGVTFNNAKFRDMWNIKYLKVKGDFDIAGIAVDRGAINSKYTEINGDSFTEYLMEEKN